jgi:hypothetical protein
MIINIFVLPVRALSSLDLSQNKLREAEAKVLALRASQNGAYAFMPLIFTLYFYLFCFNSFF